MKKIILYSILFFAVVLAGLGSSFLIAKSRAEKVKESYIYAGKVSPGEVSQLKGYLMLFDNDKFAPCWLFTGEYVKVNVLTGAKFDVFVSLLGNVQRVP